MAEFAAPFEVVCVIDHQNTGGAAPDFVMALVCDEAEGDAWILDMREREVYPRCSFEVRVVVTA